MSTENEWAASMIGRTLDGQYRLDGILGEGAMGVVFRATNLAVDKAVAIKMMRKETFAEPDAVERFKREAKLWSQLNHPSIAQVFDFGLSDDMPYLVMELIEGDQLSDVLDREGPLPPLRAISVMRQLAAALEEAHRHGVVHRDIKPQNLMLLRYKTGGRLTLKVLDFGMAKQVGSKAMTLTAPGILVGTPKYVAPEQVTENPKIDGRTDLYAAGVLFYEILTGQPPFVGTPHDVLFAHLGRQPEPLPDSIPQCVTDVVMKLLRKKPAERYQNAVELEHALETCEDALRGPSISSASNPVLTESTVRRAIETRRGHRSGKRKLGEAGPRYGLWGLLGALGMAAFGLLALSSSLSLQRKLASVMSVYKVPQDETVQNELVRLQSEAQLRAWPVVLQGTEDLQRTYLSSLLPSQSSQVQALRQKALLEQPLQPIYERFQAAVERKDVEEAIRLYAQFSNDSVYRTLAEPVFNQLSEAFVSQHLQRASSLRSEHRCPEFQAEVQKILDAMPGHPLARAEQRKECVPQAIEPPQQPGTAPVSTPTPALPAPSKQ
ncbi:MAG TPA: serine/threonine-protein kinase [Pseudomonadota bacterium]|nr:serine/threonine-protein kinase [Pseudomonadota bacterium]HNN52295.1 serine/threonine-protein kinase [Pseudomonadota bacterium]